MLILRKRINLKLFNLMATVSVIVYIGEMRRCLKKRMMEHRLALKCCNSNNGVAAHAWVESHTVNWEGAEIRGIQPNKWKKILQAIHIHPHTSNLVCGQKSVLLNTSSWFALCGRVSFQMYIGGHTPASSASMPMSRDTQSSHSLLSLHQMCGSTQYTSTMWDHSRHPTDTHLICVDIFTQWPEAYPISTLSAKAVTQAFIQGWIARFSIPSTIIADRECWFVSKLWNVLMSLLGSERTSYYPQSNGTVEQFHGSHIPQSSHGWTFCHWFCLGFGQHWKENTQATSAEIVYGTTLHLPEELCLLT